MIPQPRMKHPAFVLEEAMSAMQALGRATDNKGLSPAQLELIYLRASQINGCSVCVDMHARALKKYGDSDERIFAVSAWRDTPYFTDGERAALALTEAATRLADRADPIDDATWNEAAKHYDERAMAVLLFAIGQINVWNRLNVAVRQVAGAWKG